MAEVVGITPSRGDEVPGRVCLAETKQPSERSGFGSNRSYDSAVRENPRPEGTSAAAAAIISKLDSQLSEVTGVIQQYLVAQITELRGDAQLLDLLRDSVEGNIETIFSAIEHAIPISQVEPPTAALEYARRLAQRGVSANALVRAYRLGQQELLRVLLDDIRSSDLPAQNKLDVFEQVSSTTFGYIDWISEQVIAVYQNEREQWLEDRNRVRALQVREVLTADAVDEDAMTTAMRYPLRRFHLALVVWRPGVDSAAGLGQMERFVRDLAEHLGASHNPLFIAEDRLTGWAWIPLSAKSAAAEAVSAARAFTRGQPDPPSLAFGAALPGCAGFRRSHQQALDARAVALASNTEGAADRHDVVAISDPGLSAAALLGGDVNAARVWVYEVLGPLSSDTENDERLRHTLEVFLRSGSSFKAAAGQLNLHYNSVKYRVARAIERRGLPIENDRLEVEIALLLCRWYRGAVLS
nr:helix-turn-helix domain-containing protein [Hoyosella altamirensis]